MSVSVFPCGHSYVPVILTLLSYSFDFFGLLVIFKFLYFSFELFYRSLTYFHKAH